MDVETACLAHLVNLILEQDFVVGHRPPELTVERLAHRRRIGMTERVPRVGPAIDFPRRPPVHRQLVNPFVLPKLILPLLVGLDRKRVLYGNQGHAEDLGSKTNIRQLLDWWLGE